MKRLFRVRAIAPDGMRINEYVEAPDISAAIEIVIDGFRVVSVLSAKMVSDQVVRRLEP